MPYGADVIIPILTNLLNKFCQLGTVPNSLKCTKIKDQFIGGIPVKIIRICLKEKDKGSHRKESE